MKILQGLYDEFVTKMSTINQNKTEAFCCLAFDVDQKNHRHLKAVVGFRYTLHLAILCVLNKPAEFFGDDHPNYTVQFGQKGE